MPPTTLLCGPPGSGKTSGAAEAVARAYASDPFAKCLVLVPTQRHADQFRRAVVVRTPAAFAFEVTPPGAFAAALLAEEGRVVASRQVVHGLIARILRQRAATGPCYFAPISATRGVVALLDRPVAHLLAERVDLGRLASLPPVLAEPRLASLTAIAHELSQSLAQLDLCHPAVAPSVGASLALPSLDLVVVDGFRSLSASEVELIGALLLEAGSAVVTADPAAAPLLAQLSALPGVTREDLAPRANDVALAVGSSVDREAQLRDIARHIKQRLALDPSLRPSDVAVAVRQVGPYLRLARQVFSEYDLPLDVAAAEPLANRPLGQWLLRALRLPAAGWRLRDILPVLRSGFCDSSRWELGPSRIGMVASLARRNRLWAGVDLPDRLTAAARASHPREPERSAPLEAAVAAFGQAIDALRAQMEVPDATPAVHAARVAAWLFGPAGLLPVAAGANPGGRAELEALRRVLLATQSGGAYLASEPVSLEAFSTLLARLLEAPSVQEREAGGVLVAPAHTLAGLRFRHVYVAGLAEGEFPAPSPGRGLLSPADCAAVREAGIPLPDPHRATDDELWATLLTRAGESFTAWRTMLDDRRRERAPSGYYANLAAIASEVPAPSPNPADQASRRDLAVACVADWAHGLAQRPANSASWAGVRVAAEIEQQRRSFAPAGAFEGDLRGSRQPVSRGTPSPWSASRFETYQTCPFRFFGRYVLQLSDLEQEQEEPDAATRGTVVHDILEKLVRPLAEAGAALDHSSLPQVLARLDEIGPVLWQAAPAEHGFGRVALWRIQWPRTLEELRALLLREADASEAHGSPHVHGVEVLLDGVLPTTPPLPFTGHADRVDWGPGVAVVVDYKSSREVQQSLVTDGSLLQLQLYGAMVQQELGVPRVVGRYACLRAPDKKAWELDSDGAKYANVIAEGLLTASAVAQSVAEGAFDVHPRPRECPTYCEFKDACRVNQFSRWKWPEELPAAPEDPDGEDV